MTTEAEQATHKRCPTCGGTGGMDTDPVECYTCDGLGIVPVIKDFKDEAKFHNEFVSKVLLELLGKFEDDGPAALVILESLVLGTLTYYYHKPEHVQHMMNILHEKVVTRADEHFLASVQEATDRMSKLNFDN